MSRESSLWSSLSKARSLFGPDQIQLERVENLVAFGMPDVDGYLHTHFGRGAFTLELKAEERPARPETPLRFKVRDSQLEWNKKRWRLGGRAFYLCQVGSGSRRILYLVPGDYGGVLREGIREADLKRLCAMPRGGSYRGIGYHDKLFRRIFEARP
jgi:hypothetical protein